MDDSTSDAISSGFLELPVRTAGAASATGRLAANSKRKKANTAILRLMGSFLYGSAEPLVAGKK
jgi:hypothetical protein